MFWLSILLELGVVAFCALWPIRDHLRHAQSLQHYIDLYSVDSNLDVWAQSLLHCLMLPFCFLRVAGQNRRHRRRYASARLAISSIVYLCQVTLLEVVSDCISSLFFCPTIIKVTFCALQLLCLAKAVLVALLGEEIVWPGRHGDVGLVFMYGAICASLIGLLTQLLSATALVTGMPSILPGYKVPFWL